MNTYCLSCKSNNKTKNNKTRNNKKMMLSRCSICNNKNSSSSERIFDSLVYNTNQDRMKDALWNAFNR